jgi:antitoxin PrlF
VVPVFPVGSAAMQSAAMPRSRRQDTHDNSVRGNAKGVIMNASTITAKGQTTVPAEVRASMQVKAGTRLVWSVMPDGAAIVRAKTKSILDMAGMLKAPKGKTVKIEDMNPWR